MPKAEHVYEMCVAHYSNQESRFRGALESMASEAEKKGQQVVSARLHGYLEAYASQREGVIDPKVAQWFDLMRTDCFLEDLFIDDGVREDLMFLVMERMSRDRILEEGMIPVRHVLIDGPPGVGKTFTARALAAELGLPLYAVKFHKVVESYLGRTSMNLHEVFDLMRRTDAVFLFDEADSILSRRTSGGSSESTEVNRITNTLLRQMEDPGMRGLVLYCTNMKGLLDSAAHRRFDMVLTYKLPTDEESANYLCHVAAKYGLETLDSSEWEPLVQGLPYAQIERATVAAAKRSLLFDESTLTPSRLMESLHREQLEKEKLNADTQSDGLEAGEGD